MCWHFWPAKLAPMYSLWSFLMFHWNWAVIAGVGAVAGAWVLWVKAL